MHDNVVAFSVDRNYLHYANTLISTFYENDVHADLICRGINLTDDHVDELTDKYPKLKVNQDITDVSSSKTLMKKLDDPDELYWTYKGSVYSPKGLSNIMKTMYSPLAAYSCHSRFKTIVELLQSDYKTVLCLDADTIINKNIDCLFDKKGHDLYVVPTKKSKALWNNEGLLLINNTTSSKNFFQSVHDQIFSGTTFYEWDCDTRILSATYEKSDLDIGLLEQSFKDRAHGPDTYMWSGDGLNKTSKKFKSKVGDGED